MTVVRMLTSMTSTRYDGRDWPSFHGLIDVPEWEAEHLVSGGNAEYPGAPVLDRGYDVMKNPSPEFENNLKVVEDSDPDYEPVVEEEDYESVVNYDDDDDDFFRAEPAPEPVTESTEVTKPKPADKKELWVAYAFSLGDLNADDLTKAQLVAKYK